MKKNDVLEIRLLKSLLGHASLRSGEGSHQLSLSLDLVQT